jgi:hypothetical protein
MPGIEWADENLETVNYAGGRNIAYLTSQTADGEMVRTYLDAGESPPAGAIVTYRLAEAPEAPISLTVANSKGETVRTVTSRTADDPPKAKERRIPAAAGWNRFVWDLRHDRVTKITGSDPLAENTVAGPFVPPGRYTVTLTAGKAELSQQVEVVAPSTAQASQADLEAQYDLMMRIHAQLDRTAKTINRMRDVRAQLDGWAERAGNRDQKLAASAAELRDRVLEIEKDLAVPDCRPGWADSLNQGIRLFETLATLANDVGMGDYRPTDAAGEALENFTTRIEAVIARFDALVKKEIPAFNKQVSAAKLGAVVA